MRTFTLKGLLLTAVFMVFGCLVIHAADDDLITKQITIKLDKAGTLPNKIGDTKKYKITNLKIIGEINGSDLLFIRMMAGRDFRGDVTAGKLATLDLSEAEIVSGGGCYYYDKDYPDKYYYTSRDVIGAYAFCGCSGLTSLIIPSRVTSIDYSAFKDCSGLTSVTIPSLVTWIRKYAFYGCSGLTSLTIPSRVTWIGEYAFYGCSGLTSLIIPSSVTSIDYSAFRDCSGLTSVYVSWDTPISIFASTFENANTQNCILYVPKGTYDDYWLTDWSVFENIVEYDVAGISQTAKDKDAQELSRYSVSGQRLNAPAKGVNIVRYSDGSIRKIVTK